MTIWWVDFILDAFPAFSSNGVSRRYIRNGFDFKKLSLDRINRIYKIFFDRFPDENGQIPSPAANGFIDI